jgi:hypothetical protein
LTIWVLYARAPAPNLPYWRGRRWLVLLDAAMWPALLAFNVVTFPLNAGVVGPVTLALCAFIGIRACARALWHKEQYRFTTWRLGAPFGALLALGIVLKLVV